VPRDLRFEWDPAKDRSNRPKHGISFEEAKTAFLDDNARVIPDPEHSEDEERFVLLGLTGLNITFGKLLLLPLIGPEAFSTFSEGAKYVHNFVSFPFVLGLVLIITIWMKDNVLRKVDVVWLKEGGGFIPSKHPTAGRFNAGEKLVFWLALGAGAAVSVSGYLLLFPFYVTDIFGMQIAQGVHAVIAVLFIALIIGHIYIGTLGMEGAFEAMGTGSVDLNWAKEHHGLWLEEEIAKGRAKLPAPATPAE